MLHYLPETGRTELAAAHRRYGECFPLRATAPHGNPADPERPLRIGDLSADIRRHAAARLLEPLLRGRDRNSFQVFLYGQVEALDQVSERLIGLADDWCATAGLSSEQLAARIRRDAIDLLVDLAGHTAGNRVDVLPLQVTTLGYPGSTGLDGLDGRISDVVLDPAGEERFSSEPLLRLAGSFACFQPPVDAPEPGDPPCLACGPLRLLSPHQLFKFNEPLLRLWARVLERLPSAELELLRAGTSSENHAALAARLAHCGIHPAQVRMGGLLRYDNTYLSAIVSCDLMLDSWPHSGHTTSCEALWMALPVITLRGDLPCGRLSASVLSALGRPEWITGSAEAYVATAFAVAGDRAALRAARHLLRGQMAATVADASSFMGRLEALNRLQWRHWWPAATPKALATGPIMVAAPRCNRLPSRHLPWIHPPLPPPLAPPPSAPVWPCPTNTAPTCRHCLNDWISRCCSPPTRPGGVTQLLQERIDLFTPQWPRGWGGGRPAWGGERHAIERSSDGQVQ